MPRCLIVILFGWAYISDIDLWPFSGWWDNLYYFALVGRPWGNRSVAQTILRITPIGSFEVDILRYWISFHNSLSHNIGTHNDGLIVKLIRIWHLSRLDILMENGTRRSLHRNMVWWSYFSVAMTVGAVMSAGRLKCNNFAENPSTMIIVHNSKLLYPWIPLLEM